MSTSTAPFSPSLRPQPIPPVTPQSVLSKPYTSDERNNKPKRPLTYNWSVILTVAVPSPEIVRAVQWWFEPYELPTEEEIRDVLESEIEEDVWGKFYERSILLAAKAITNLLKGER